MAGQHIRRWCERRRRLILAAQRVQQESRVTALYAALGTILIILAIPLGLMLAPLVIGAILLVVAMRRADRALNEPFAGAQA
jgi:hypothetical protein